MIVSGWEHQHLPALAAVEDLAGAEGLQARHGQASLRRRQRLVAAAQGLDAATATQAGCVGLVLHALVQQGEVVILKAAVCFETGVEDES